MYISSAEISISQTETLLRPIVFIVVSILSGIPILFVYKKLKNSETIKKDFTDSAFYKMIAVVYTLVFLFGIIRTAARFDLFASSELFPGTEMTIFIIVLIVVCALLSLLGLGALSRAGSIFTVVVVTATSFVILSLVDEVDFLNFTPLFEDGVPNFLWDSLLFALQASEIGAITLVLSQLKGNVGKNYILWAVFSGLSFSVILFFVVGTLGAFADTQLFPTYTAVTLAKFGLIERMDALETAIWILCVVVKISFYILITVKCLKKVLVKVSEKILRIAVCVALAVIPAFVSDNIESFGFVSNNILTLVLYAVSVIILPCILLVYYRKVKPYEKISEDI